IFYMGINLGAFVSPFVCGFLAQKEWFRGVLSSAGVAPESAWHYGFAAAAVGMFLGLVQFVVTRRHLGDAGLPGGSTQEAARSRRRLAVAVLGILIALGVVAWLGSTGRIRITKEGIADAYGVALVLTTLLFFGWLFLRGNWTPAERRRLVVLT